MLNKDQDDQDDQKIKKEKMEDRWREGKGENGEKEIRGKIKDKGEEEKNWYASYVKTGRMNDEGT